MCTFKVSIDDALLERVRPAFADNVEIGSWMQSHIEKLLQQIADQEFAVDKDMTVEEAYDLVCNDLKCIYGLSDGV